MIVQMKVVVIQRGLGLAGHSALETSDGVQNGCAVFHAPFFTLLKACAGDRMLKSWLSLEAWGGAGRGLLGLCL